MASRLGPIVVRRLLPTISREKRPWYVECAYCDPGLEFFRGFFGMNPRSETWAAAFSWALEHARLHEQAKCQTCGHVPSREDRPDKRYP